MEEDLDAFEIGGTTTDEHPAAGEEDEAGGDGEVFMGHLFSDEIEKDCGASGVEGHG